MNILEQIKELDARLDSYYATNIFIPKELQHYFSENVKGQKNRAYNRVGDDLWKKNKIREKPT